MNITLGLFAHVDAGKTTFAEQVLYHTRSIQQRGRGDNKDAFLDSHEIEKERGITIFADQAVMTYRGNIYTLIDTPGHVDFSAEMERAIQVMDVAVIIVSSVEGIQGHTETVWKLLQERGVPTVFFLNKIDRVGADVDQVIADIHENLTPDIINMTSYDPDQGLSEEIIAFMAERNDQLFELYMEEGYEQAVWLREMRHMLAERRWFPCVCGSALQDVGVQQALELIHQFVQTEYCTTGEMAGLVYKVRFDDQGTRTTHMKVTSGTLSVRDEIRYGTEVDTILEKITSIRVYNGQKAQKVEFVEAGQLCAVTGLTAASAGVGVGAYKDTAIYHIVPTLKSKVIFPAELHVKEVLACFHRLDAEDPALRVQWDEHVQEIHIHVMGAIQLEVLARIVKERFGITVSFADPEILYKETIRSTVNGCGHFEPLGHYAEARLRMEPGERDSGIQVFNECHPDELGVNYQNLIMQHLLERDHHGLLTGSPLTDVRITLLTGRAHNCHTSGGDFREASFRALRQGLEQADNVLLEPYYDFKITVDTDDMGKVMADVQKAHGALEPPAFIGSKAVITGKVPVSTFMNYSTELAAYTQGKGMIQLLFGGYDVCHNADEVIARKSYDKDADPAYTSSSIFCAKGQAYRVPWDEADSHMHSE
ncbi:elongation factor G [Paenibacillus sp. KS1]|uniref:GTP-binding protein n=1 Tax=Paenibacillus sp. KS1 TaxID=1849249 RepID=UPI0008064DCC|nr:TetM/TetW/TetO/TetS family tetracycline resistance ribosomal protection protein [Paenibacillus sp. KS1]OBY78746.1 elongation factor G [Paenibacillus sp. KS1]